MTKNEKIEEEISRHLNAANSFTRKRVEDNLEYKAALQKGDLDTALKLAYGMIYGAAETKKRHRDLMEIKRSTDELLGR